MVLTTYGLYSDVLSALEAGATGYLLKDALGDLMRAVRGCVEGRVGIVSIRCGKPAKEKLSQREPGILHWASKDGSNLEIAEALFISEVTINTHLLHVYEKLGVRDRAAAVGEVYRHDFLH